MNTLGTILVILGIVYVWVILFKPPFIMKSKKVEIFKKLMGEKGFWIFMYVFTVLVLGAGILILVLI